MASAQQGNPLLWIPRRSKSLQPCIIGLKNGPQPHAEVVERCDALVQTKARHVIVHIADLTETQTTIISTSLSQSPRVREIEVLGRRRNSTVIGDQGASAAALPDNTSPLGALLERISANASLLELEISHLTIDGRTLDSLAMFLNSPTCRLQKLMMRGCNEACTNEDAAGFAEACQVNGSVKKLRVQGGSIPFLYGALVTNPATSLARHPATTTLEVRDSSKRDSFIQHDLLQSKLAIRSRGFSIAECERLVDAIRRGNALRELIVTCDHLLPHAALLFSEMIQGLGSLQVVKIQGVMLKAASGLSLVQAVQSNSSIHTIAMRPTGLFWTNDNATDFAAAVGRLLESSPHVMHLEVGRINGILQLTRGLERSRTLRSLTIHDDNRQGPLLWKSLIEQGLCHNTSLKRLDLQLPITDEVSRPLASYIRSAKNLRTIKLRFRQLEGSDWPMVIRALALHPVLEQVSLAAPFTNMTPLLRANMADELASVMPKLWMVHSLDTDTSMGEWNMMATASHMSLWKLNMSLTSIYCRPYHAPSNEEEEAMERAVCRIKNRNQRLSRVDYGVKLPPLLWPLMIEMALRNEPVGPSFVFRLLKKRPAEIKTRGSSTTSARDHPALPPVQATGQPASTTTEAAIAELAPATSQGRKEDPPKRTFHASSEPSLENDGSSTPFTVVDFPVEEEAAATGSLPPSPSTNEEQVPLRLSQAKSQSEMALHESAQKKQRTPPTMTYQL